MIAHPSTDTARSDLEQLPARMLRADIEFGTMSRDGDCVNIGICRVEPNVRNRSDNRHCPHAEVLLGAGEQGNLRMFFPRNGMKPCTIRAFFSNWLFALPVPFVLHETLVRRIEGLRQSILPAGAYPIRRTENGFWLEF